MDALDIKWNDFKLNVELHKSYLDLALKINLFYYAITGAILSFYFTQTEVEHSQYALVLPILLSLALAVFFFKAGALASNLRTHIRNTANDLGLNAYPEGIVLVFICYMSGALMSVVFLGIAFLFCSAV